MKLSKFLKTFLDFKLSLILFYIQFCTSSSTDHTFNLTIIHLNNFEARFLPTDVDGKLCKDSTPDVKQTCFGGYARLKHKIEEIRNDFPDAILLNAGDFVQGTILSTFYGWNISSYFLNQLPHTAFIVGYKELEVGIKEDLPAFLKNLNTPIVSCNMFDSDTTQTDVMDKINKSIVVEIDGKLIGITGYINTGAKTIPSSYEMEFLDERDSVRKEVDRLRNDQKVSAVVVLSQGGYDMDLEIAKLHGVDVIVGGRSSTFLYSGSKLPSIEKNIGPYPTEVVNENEVSALVVQAYRFGKYLGFLQLQFSDGKLASWSGNPILLDESVPEDPKGVADVALWNEDLVPFRKTTVGYTHVYLDGSLETCGQMECNMGNLVADSMIYGSLKYAIDFQWNYAAIGLLDAGGLRSSINSSVHNGSITVDDLYGVLPFRNSIDFIEIKGEHIYEIFELSAMDLHVSPQKGFLQVSGIQITVDICKPPGERVKELLVVCNECRSPTYEPLQKDIYYRLVLPGYLSMGGGGHSIFPKFSISHQRTELVDIDVLREYLQKHGAVTAGLEERIVILGDPSCYKNQGFRQSIESPCLIIMLVTIIANLLYGN